MQNIADSSTKDIDVDLIVERLQVNEREAGKSTNAHRMTAAVRT